MFRMIVFVTIAVALLLSACAPAVAGLVGLPEDAKQLIMALVTAGLTWLLVKLSTLIKFDLSGYAPLVAAAISPIIIAIIEYYLGMIPPVWDSILLTIIHLVVLLLSSLGALVLPKLWANKKGVRHFLAV